MCLAMPAEVTAIDGETATVDMDGASLVVSLELIENVRVGDFVVIHVGYALSVIDREQADRQIALMRAGAPAVESPDAVH